MIIEEEAQLLTKIRAYNAAQEKITHTWHGYAGYYGEDEAKTKMQHVRTQIACAEQDINRALAQFVAA